MTERSFLQDLATQRWDDHRYYHHSRINQALHFISALSFIAAYGLLFVHPAAAALLAWCVSMTARQAGHFFFEPQGYDHVNRATHDHKEAIKVGYNPSGMILRPDFYTPPLADKTSLRREAGPDAHTPTGLVLFGGTGSRVMKPISAALRETPLVLLCGRNETLAAELRAMPAAAPRVVVSYTTEVARWMQCADFFIGKPGPGSLSEAVQQGLPVIVTRNAWTLPQERWNTDWVQALGLGVVKRSFGQVGAAVQELVAELPRYRANVAQMHNRAVFEVPQVLHGISQAQAKARAAPHASPA